MWNLIIDSIFYWKCFNYNNFISIYFILIPLLTLIIEHQFLVLLYLMVHIVCINVQIHFLSDTSPWQKNVGCESLSIEICILKQPKLSKKNKDEFLFETSILSNIHFITNMFSVIDLISHIDKFRFSDNSLTSGALPKCWLITLILINVSTWLGSLSKAFCNDPSASCHKPRFAKLTAWPFNKAGVGVALSQSSWYV